jgi:hypothetical protein
MFEALHILQSDPAPAAVIAQGGGGGGGGFNIQVIVFLIFILFSTFSWILRALNEARKRKKAQDAARRRADEALRTGRDPISGAPIAGSRAPVVEQTFSSSPAQASEEQRLREIAERRRRQMAEAQQRQQGGSRTAAGAGVAGAGSAGGSAGSAGGTGGGLVLTTDASGRLVIARTEQAGTPRPGEGRPKKRKDQNRQRTGEQRSGEQRPRGDSDRDMLARRQAMEQDARRRAQLEALRRAEEADLRRPVLSPAAAAAAAAEDRRSMSNPYQPNVGVSLGGIPQTPDQWRAAIIAAEVLGPPVCMRPPG